MCPTDCPHETHQVVQAVVANAYGADLAGFDALDEGLPHALAVGRAAKGGVDQHQIEIDEPGLGQRLVDDLLGDAVEQLLRVDAGACISRSGGQAAGECAGLRGGSLLPWPR